MRDFSKILALLTKLTCKGVKFLWNDDCEVSFQKLKECLISTLVLALPLTKLMRKGVKLLWNDDYEVIFQKLKEYLISTLVLALPFGTGGYTVYYDASRVGLGCV